MNILIIDMHNKFRSKVAESILKKLAGGKIGVKSVGLILDSMRPFVCQNVHESLNKRGYRIDNDQPRHIYRQDLDWADKIIIVNKNFPTDAFSRVKNKLILWEVEGADETEKDKIDNIVAEIESRVKDFLKETKPL